MKEKIWLSWSSGKDCAYALYVLQKEDRVVVDSLITTITSEYDRVSMHSTRRRCLELQATSLGLPLNIVKIPAGCTNDVYESRFLSVLSKAKVNNVSSIAYGDLFLGDVKAYRERLHKKVEVAPFFPLWNMNTKLLARQIVDLVFKAITSCINPQKLPSLFIDRKFDHSFLDDLPKSVDPCGENGEFHTFVFNGPNFNWPVQIEVVDTVERDGFLFADMLAH